MTMNLDDRRRIAGLSYIELARRSGVGYPRLWRNLAASTLTDEEVARIKHVLDSAERELREALAG